MTCALDMHMFLCIGLTASSMPVRIYYIINVLYVETMVWKDPDQFLELFCAFYSMKQANKNLTKPAGWS